MFDDDHPDIMKHIKAETEAREQLAAADKRLEKYQSIYGDPSQLPLDLKGMEERLRTKEEEVERLRLVDKQRSQVSKARMI
jgi:E3 ubiquitin-protein ligase BRE1